VRSECVGIAVGLDRSYSLLDICSREVNNRGTPGRRLPVTGQNCRPGSNSEAGSSTRRYRINPIGAWKQ